MKNSAPTPPSTLLAGPVPQGPLRGSLPDRYATPRSSGIDTGPQLLMSGEQAMRVAAQILKTSRSTTVPSVFGNVELRPGRVGSNNRMILDTNWTTVYYLIDDRLYEISISNFLRGEWYNAYSSGASKAAWLIPIAKAEMALLTGLFVPWYLLLAVVCGKTTAVYQEHKNHFEIVWEQGSKMLDALQCLRQKYPTFFNLVIKKIAKDTFSNLPQGVTGEDIGFLLGRILRGIDGLPEVTLGGIVKISASVSWKIAALHLPNIVAHSAESSFRHNATEIQNHLRSLGYTVTYEEAQAILKDAVIPRDFQATLTQLELASKALAPSLKEIETALYN